MMKYSSRAFACLIVYLFLGLYVVTWAGNGGPSERFKVGIGAQFAGVGAHARVDIQRAPTETQALTKERKELRLLCEKLLEQVQKEQKKTGLSGAQRAALEEKEKQLWNLLTSAIETRLVAGQGESEDALDGPPEATPAHLPQDEALAEARKAVTLCIQCLEESLAEPSVQADAQLWEIFKARRELALLKKQQLEQALQAPATEGGEIAKTRSYWHSAYQAVQSRLESEASAQAVVEEAERLYREASVSGDPEQAYQFGFYFLEQRKRLEAAQSSYWTAEKIEETMRGCWTMAAQDGHQQAALRLLRSYKPMGLTHGTVFYQLYRLEVENQSPFPADVRAQFLARALLAKDIKALKDLNTWIDDDIAQGNTRVNARNEQWKQLREVLVSFKKNDPDSIYQIMSKTLLQEVQGIYKQGEKKTLRWLKEADSDYESDSDGESLNKRVAQEIEKVKQELQQKYEQALNDQEAKFQTELSQKEQALKTLETQQQQPDKRILFIGLSGHGKTTSINTFASVLLGGQRCQFIIPTVRANGSRYPIEGDNGLRTEGIIKVPYTDNILPFPETNDPMMSDTNRITGYMVQRAGQTYELIDTPGLNNNRGKLTDEGEGEANNRTLLEALRAEIIRGEQTGQMIDAVVFVLSPTVVRVNCSTGCSNYSLLSLGIKDLIDSFPKEVVNTNFFFLANKCGSETEMSKLYDDVKVALPQVRYERFKQIGEYDAIDMSESEIWNDDDRAQMTPDQLCQEKLNRLRYQKACAVFQALDNEIASLETPIRALAYLSYMNIYQQLADLVGQRLEADRKHKQLEKTHEKQQFDSFLDECKRDYHQAQIVKSKQQEDQDSKKEDEDSKKSAQFFRQSAQKKQDECNQLKAEITTHQENMQINYPKQARALVKALSNYPQYFQTGDYRKIIDQVMTIAKVKYKEYDQDVIENTIGELIGT